MKTRDNVYISTFNQHGVLDLAESFYESGWNIVADGNSYLQIDAAAIPVRAAWDLPGWHATIAVGVSVDRSKGNRQAAKDRQRIYAFGAVCIDMMPPKLILNEGFTQQEKLEKLDFYRPEILSLAANCGRIAVSQDKQRPIVADWLRAGRPGEAGVISTLSAVALLEVGMYTTQRNWFMRTTLGKGEGMTGFEEDLRKGLDHGQY